MSTQVPAQGSQKDTLYVVTHHHPNYRLLGRVDSKDLATVVSTQSFQTRRQIHGITDVILANSTQPYAPLVFAMHNKFSKEAGNVTIIGDQWYFEGRIIPKEERALWIRPGSKRPAPELDVCKAQPTPQSKPPVTKPIGKSPARRDALQVLAAGVVGIVGVAALVPLAHAVKAKHDTNNHIEVLRQELRVGLSAIQPREATPNEQAAREVHHELAQYTEYRSNTRYVWLQTINQLRFINYIPWETWVDDIQDDYRAVDSNNLVFTTVEQQRHLGDAFAQYAYQLTAPKHRAEAISILNTTIHNIAFLRESLVGLRNYFSEPTRKWVQRANVLAWTNSQIALCTIVINKCQSDIAQLTPHRH